MRRCVRWRAECETSRTARKFAAENTVVFGRELGRHSQELLIEQLKQFLAQRAPRLNNAQCRAHGLGPRSIHARTTRGVYDVNVLSTSRVNRAVLPSGCARQKRGLVVWVERRQRADSAISGDVLRGEGRMDALARSLASALNPRGY